MIFFLNPFAWQMQINNVKEKMINWKEITNQINDKYYPPEEITYSLGAPEIKIRNNPIEKTSKAHE